jgi:hypothetical protein
LKKIVTILFAIALYAPQVGQILSYSQCVLANANSINSLVTCGCSIPDDENNEGKIAHQNHTHSTLKADWKFIIHTFNFDIPKYFVVTNAKHFAINVPIQLPQYFASIFHPPAIVV